MQITSFLFLDLPRVAFVIVEKGKRKTFWTLCVKFDPHWKARDFYTIACEKGEIQIHLMKDKLGGLGLLDTNGIP